MIYDIQILFGKNNYNNFSSSNPCPFSLHSTLRSHSLTPEHAGYTTDTKRGKKGTEVISHSNQQHKMILSLCTMFYRWQTHSMCLWWSSPCFWETHFFDSNLSTGNGILSMFKMDAVLKKHPAISIKNKVQTTGHKQAKCDINKVLILGARHKQTCQLNKTF